MVSNEQLRAALLTVRALEAQIEGLLASSDEPVDLTQPDLVPRYFKSERVLRGALKSGRLRGARVGRQIVVRRADLDAFLGAQTVAAVAPVDDDEAILARGGLKVSRR